MDPYEGDLIQRVRTYLERPRRLESATPGRATAASGFTLIELLVAVTIVGILASIAIPAFMGAIEKARINRLVADFKTFEKGFLAFAVDTGEFPPDSHLETPYHLANGVGIEKYLPLTAWVTITPLGGQYNWEGPDNYPYAGISLFGTTASVETMLKVDAVIDDGNLAAGAFRKTPNSRYTYIIDE